MQKRVKFLRKSHWLKSQQNLTDNSNFFINFKRAQVTIFVILALVIVGGIGGYFLFKDKIFPQTVPAKFLPIYNKYLSCIQLTASDGVKILGSGAGYIQPPSFEAGSTYAPFSNQLGFMGNAVPYWYYISRGGMAKEQIPTVADMEKQLADYVAKQTLEQCDFSEFSAQGFNVTFLDSAETSAKAKIRDNSISVSLYQKISIAFEDSSITISNHDTAIDSSLGKLYSTAKKIYNYEKSNMFLETYSRDVLYNYAPVEGMLLNCSPAIWSPYAVVDKLKSALTANIGLIKINGDYYGSKNSYTDYFIVGKSNNDLKLDNEQVSFVYSADWPARFEVWPTKNNIMTAEPIGNQPGLGAMGFCYIPYKFTYDLYFPVLIQIYNPTDASQIFQFPFAVVIDKNAPRKAVIPQSYTSIPESACDTKNGEIMIRTYGPDLSPVEAEVQISCLNDICNLGKTKLDNSTGIASATVGVPQCMNSIITAKSTGYKDTAKIVSTNEESSVDLVMQKQKTFGLEVYVDGSLVSADMAMLSLKENIDNQTSDVGSAYYPLNREIKLAAGDYNFDLKVYKAGTLTVPATTTTQCVTLPRSDLLGMMGMTEEKCADLTVPSQTLTNVLYAGGTIDQYISQSEIESGKIIRVYATSTPLPKRAEEIGSNFDLIGHKTLYVEIV